MITTDPIYLAQLPTLMDGPLGQLKYDGVGVRVWLLDDARATVEAWDDDLRERVILDPDSRRAFNALAHARLAE